METKKENKNKLVLKILYDFFFHLVRNSVIRLDFVHLNMNTLKIEDANRFNNELQYMCIFSQLK